MASGCESLQYGDEKARPLFGLSFAEAAVLVLVYEVAHSALGKVAHGLLALGPPAVLWGILVLGHQVRMEPVVSQLFSYLQRRLLPKVPESTRRFVILEVDGFTRDALTDEEQDIRLIKRLQTLLTSLGTRGTLQMIALTTTRSTEEIIAEERALVGAHVSAELRELAARGAARLEGRIAPQATLHLYVVVYEQDTRALPGGAPVPALLRGFFPAPQVESTGLADLVSGVQDVLGMMELTARPVDAIAGDDGPIAQERARSVELDGQVYAASAYMLAPPGVTDPGFLEPLFALEAPVRVAIWIEGRDAGAERARIQMRQRQAGASLMAGMMGGKGPTADEQAAVGENNALLLRLRRPDQGIVRGGVYVTCFGRTRAGAIRRIGRAVSLMRQRLAAQPAGGLGLQGPLYLGTMPGADTARRYTRMHAETAANTYPFNRRNPTTARGYRIGVTDRGEDVRFDPTDPSLRNALCISVGLSGMGKSQLALKMLKMHLIAGGRATVLDRSGHYGLLGSLCGAATVETADELDAVPLQTQMVIVDLRAQRSIASELLAALDRRTQTVVGTRLHLFILEEAWQLQHMGAALWVNDLARRGRHWAGFVWWITHQVEDMVEHPEIKSMFSSAATKVIFALDDRTGTATTVGTALGATPAEVQTIKGLAVGQAYLMRHNKQRGSVVRGGVRVVIDPDEAWLFESDPRSWQYARREQELAQHPGSPWAAIKTLSDTLPFSDDEEAPAPRVRLLPSSDAPNRSEVAS